MGLDELLSELSKPRRVQEHPDWPDFAEQPLPTRISFYYTNDQGDEAYWQDMRIVKIDLERLHLRIEGAHGDPLRFDILKITGCKDAATGKRVQGIWADLARMWLDIHGESVRQKAD